MDPATSFPPATSPVSLAGGLDMAEGRAHSLAQPPSETDRCSRRGVTPKG